MSTNNVQSSVLASYIQQQKAQGSAPAAPKAPVPVIEEPKNLETKPDTLEVTKPQEVKQEPEKETPSKFLDKIKDKAKKLLSNKKALIAVGVALGAVIIAAIVLIANHNRGGKVDPASDELEGALNNLADALGGLFGHS